MVRDCITCKDSLGGGFCRLNSERECADDDARPLWKPETIFADYAAAGDYRDLLQPESWAARMVDGKVIATYE